MPPTSRKYAAALARYSGRRGAGAVALLMLTGLTEGVGLLVLLPLLGLIGLASGAGGGRIAEIFGGLFTGLGLPLTLPAVLGLFVAIVTLRAVLVRWRDVVITEIRLGFVDHLRVGLYGAIGRARWQHLAAARMSDLSHVLTTDITRVGQGTYVFLNLAVTGFLAVVQVAVAWALSPLVAGAALGTGALILLALRRHIRDAQQMGANLTEANRKVFATVSDFLSGVKLAKSYGTEADYARRFEAAVTGLRQEIVGFTRSNQANRMAYQIAAAVALAGLLYGAVEIVELAAAELVVLVLIFARLTPILLQMQQDFQHYRYMLPAFAAAEALRADCEAQTEIPVTESPTTASLGLDREIRLEDVGFTYDGGDGGALDGLNLVLPARKVTALVGPSGAGKSTLADLLMGLLAPGRGQILIDGQPLVPGNLAAWRRSVGYVPQDTFLLNDTIRANLVLARPGAGEADLEAALKLAAADFIDGLPERLDTVVGERGLRLSGGERQRIALARALLRRPDLLILDEATSALDAENERRIQHAIAELSGKLTIIVIAHRLSTVRAADLIVVLDGGRVAESGTWDELLARSGGRLGELVEADGLG